MKFHRYLSGFTLVEALVALTLTCGVLATLGVLTFKHPWNQSAIHRMKALGFLRAGIERNVYYLPEFPRTWNEQPGPGWRIEWSWSEINNDGWKLEGEAYGPMGRRYGKLWVARWKP